VRVVSSTHNLENRGSPQHASSCYRHGFRTPESRYTMVRAPTNGISQLQILS
jgi:hypothetical protein